MTTTTDRELMSLFKLHLRHWLRRKLQPVLYYTQDEVAEQISQIDDLTKQREKALQLLVVRKSDKARYEVDQLDIAIETSEAVLVFMLDKNVQKLPKAKKRRS